MNVLSLFDGMSCGQQALERAGFKVTNYFASEIDKHAIKVTMANYPNTIQLGSVVDVDGYLLPKIDLLIGGSPCQSFSFAGKRKGMSTKDEQEILTLEHYLQLKAEGFEFEGQSYLFWEYMRLLNETKPKYFLLENVEMGEKWERVLSKAIGVNGIHINSALVSAQNRKRIYWTNIGHVPSGLFGDLACAIKQPKDKGILLKDILESEVDDKYYLSEKMINCLKNHSDKKQSEGCGFKFEPSDGNRKSKILTTKPGTRTDDNYIVHNTMPRSSTSGKGETGPLSRTDGKTYCLDTGQTNAVEIVGLTEIRTAEAKQIRKETGTNPKRAKELVERTDGKTGAILTSQTPDNLVRVIDRIGGFYGQTTRWGIYNDNGISPTITASMGMGGGHIPMIEKTSRIRRLTPTECERLQTVADGYTNHVSDSQRYKMLGNGWTVEVIVHILNYMKI